MSTMTPTQPTVPASGSDVVEPTETLYRMTVDEYERIGQFLDDAKVELIDGLLVRKMTKNSPHSVACGLAQETLRPIIPAGWHLRMGEPVRIPERNYPEPDLALARGVPRDYTSRHPGPNDVALVIEISDSTLAKDRRRVRIYGAAAIPSYWIVNLEDRQVETYWQPFPEGYLEKKVYVPGEVVPLRIGTVAVVIPVDDMLP